ncbi:hypothetical protein NC652_025712 [Populus alba x Populus x berolinensis]|nr:hypothetical protein NC652_025712 [Populus alba x Populus x berolinensis]
MVPLSKQIIDLRGHFNIGTGSHILSVEKYTEEISLIYESSLAENFQTLDNRCPQASDDTTTKRSSIFKLSRERWRRQEKAAVSCNKQNSNLLGN